MWIPCFFLLLFSPLELRNITISNNGKIPWSFRNVSQLAALLLLILVVTVELVITKLHAAKYPEDVYAVHLVTPAIRILTLITVTVLVLLDRKKGIRSSGVLFLFWFILVICGIAQLRTEISYLGSLDSILLSDESQMWRNLRALGFLVSYSLSVFSLLLNFVSDKAPVNHLKAPNTSPEAGASFPRRLIFQWFDRITWHGYKRPLQVEDLFELLEEDSSDAVIPPFDKYWQESVQKNRRKGGELEIGQNLQDGRQTKETKGSVLPVLFKAFGGPFLFAGFLKLCMDLLSFVSPILLG